jgi:hypothetical protein
MESYGLPRRSLCRYFDTNPNLGLTGTPAVGAVFAWSGEPLLGLPVAVLIRTTFSRLDVHKKFISLLDQYHLVSRDRAKRLTLPEFLTAEGERG